MALNVQSFSRAQPITPSDTVDIPLVEGQQPWAIWVGGAGIVVAVYDDGSTANFTCTAGTLLPVRCKRVNSTTTSATLLVGLHQI